MALGWLDAVLASAPGSTTLAGCHPTTGALLNEPCPPGRIRTGSTPESNAYRPSLGMTALVKARDGRCRFPGCSIAARFCDLDHVRPWPAGPTHPANLICLCRRHHRTKQRHGWRVTLHDDGTTTWTDPTGRRRTTWPRDALHALVLHNPATGSADGPASVGADGAPMTHPRTEIPDGPHSHLEFVLEHLTAAPAGTTPSPRTAWRGHRSLQLIRTGATIEIDPGAHWPHHRPPPSARCKFEDPPPF